MFNKLKKLLSSEFLKIFRASKSEIEQRTIDHLRNLEIDRQKLALHPPFNANDFYGIGLGDIYESYKKIKSK